MISSERKKALRSLRSLLKLRKGELLKTLAEETRRSELECYTTEYLPSVACIKWLQSSGESFFIPTRLRAHTPISFGYRKIIEKRIPLGKVLIITTWNYPLQITFRQVLLALYSGNTVYLKPPQQAERTCKILFEMFRSVSEFTDKIHLLTSDHNALGDVWSRIDGVVFTGSTRIGKEISYKAAEHSIPAIIEASGYDSVITGEDILSDSLFDHLVWALTTHSGETCIAPKIFWYKKKNTDIYKNILTEKLRAYTNEVQWKGYTNSSVSQSITSYIDDAHRHGFTDIYMNEERVALIEAPSIEALEEVSGNALSNGGIPFAPVLVCVPYSNFDDVKRWMSGKYAGLMVTTLGLTGRERQQIEATVDVSVLNHNEFLVAGGIPSVALGGSGYSGIGRSGGFEYMRQLTKTQTIVKPGLFANISRSHWKVFIDKDNIGYRLLKRKMNRG